MLNKYEFITNMEAKFCKIITYIKYVYQINRLCFMKENKNQ